MEDLKKNALDDILKIIKIRYSREISLFIKKFIDGDYDDYEVINNEIISETLGIKKTKAYTIIKILRNYNILRSSENKNNYYIIEKDKLEEIFINLFEMHMDHHLGNFSKVFNRDVSPNLYMKMNPLKGISFYNKVYDELDLNSHTYHELSITSLSTPVPWNELKDFERDFFNGFMHSAMYTASFKRFSIIKSRLEKIHKNNGEGKLYYILFLNRSIQIMERSLVIKNATKEEINNSILLYLNKIKTTIQEFQRYFKKNILYIILDFNRTCFNGPISIIPPYVFQMYYENVFENKVYELFINFGKTYFENIVNIYKRFFNNLLFECSIVNEETSSIGIYKELGQLLYNHCLEVIKTKISQIKDSE
ncbi:MAG: hypothetical protein ACTSPY_16565 [Candidatus Helarchaeota archaeon]